MLYLTQIVFLILFHVFSDFSLIHYDKMDNFLGFFCSLGWSQTLYVAQAGFELMILLILHLECLDYRYLPPCKYTIIKINNNFIILP